MARGKGGSYAVLCAQMGSTSYFLYYLLLLYHVHGPGLEEPGGKKSAWAKGEGWCMDIWVSLQNLK